MTENGDIVDNSKFIEFTKLAQQRQSQIPPERLTILDSAIEKIANRMQESNTVDLIFVCTHNSRRSHFGQVWAQIAADHFGLNQIKTYSCGTEATACNHRTVASLRRSGMSITTPDADSDNPKYLVAPHKVYRSMELYSKTFADESLPQTGAVAMFCCDDADEKCPIVPSAAERVALSYVDPKVSDDTDLESTTYDDRSLQIASEMFYVLSSLASQES